MQYLTSREHLLFPNRFFRRSAFYDTEAFVLDIGLMYEAPPSGEENLEPYVGADEKKPNCVTTTIQEVAEKVNADKREVADEVNSSGNTKGSLLVFLIVGLAAFSFL